MRNARAAVTLATLSLALAAGATGADASTGRTVTHHGATLTGSGHARTGVSAKVAIGLALPPGDSLSGYTLDFGDHTKTSRGSKLPRTASHTYLRAGRYVVKLVATDRHHVSRKASLVETVIGKPVKAAGAGAPTADSGVGASGLPIPPAGCNGTSTPGVNAFDTTPAGDGPWMVPLDPCNSEGVGDDSDDRYDDGDYWAAEKRPDIWTNAVLRYGYPEDPYGPWNVEEDAARAGYPIDSTPQVGDVAAWNDNAVMGIDSTGSEQDAGSGGQVAYVEAVDPDGTIVVSEMGAGAMDGGYTYTLTCDPATVFIHGL